MKWSEEEADRWDEYYTSNIPKIDLSKPGLLTKSKSMSIMLDDYSTDVILSQINKTEKSAAEIIADLIIREIFPDWDSE
jgi:Ca2+-dependent lipid-binding protein